MRWYRLAATAADRSGDTDTRVWARGRSALAHVAGVRGDKKTAKQLLDQARRV